MCEKLSIAIIGLIGVIVGSCISVIGTILLHHLQEKAKAKSEEPRKNLLSDMLHDPRFAWRSLETLSHVIGADEETTKALLIQVGARASEDGKGVWGCLKSIRYQARNSSTRRSGGSLARRGARRVQQCRSAARFDSASGECRRSVQIRPFMEGDPAP